MSINTTDQRVEAGVPSRSEDRRRRRGVSHAPTGYLFVAPFMLVFLGMLVLPLAYAAYLSLFQERLICGTVFAGLDNYTRALTDPRLLEGIGRVGLFFLIQVPIMLVIALVAAFTGVAGAAWPAR